MDSSISSSSADSLISSRSNHFVDTIMFGSKFECDVNMISSMEYKDDILANMRAMELKNRPNSNYLQNQADISSSMRSILVDYLVIVTDDYKLSSETLYLAVNYIDRFLSQIFVQSETLLLVGTASIYLAAKYEENRTTDVNQIIYKVDDIYTHKQVLRMEKLLLEVLDFRINTPTANFFLLHFIRFIIVNTDNDQVMTKRVQYLSKYLSELTLQDEKFLCYLPSQIAASSIYLAMHMCQKEWTKQIEDICGYHLSELKYCIYDIYKAMQLAPINLYQAVHEKYKDERFDAVALIHPLSHNTFPAHIFSSLL